MVTTANISKQAKAAGLRNAHGLLSADLVPFIVINVGQGYGHSPLGWRRVRLNPDGGGFLRSKLYETWADFVAVNPGSYARVAVNRDTAWIRVDETDPKAATPCEHHTSRPCGQINEYSICGRPQVDGNDACASHKGQAERRIARHEKWDQERADRDENSRRADLTAADLTELWLQAADAIGIEPERSGTVRCPDPTSAVVDTEALRSLLMWAIERR